MGERKALVVGINDYPTCPLRGCCNDSEAIKDLLSNHGNGDPNFSVWKKDNVATKGELRGLIEKCFEGDADVALFYYSGHGHIDAVGGYLVTPDFSENDYGVSLQEILTIANKSKCKERIIILDSCYSGFMGSINTDGQNTANINEGVTIMTASRNSQTSMEVNGHGVFTSLREVQPQVDMTVLRKIVNYFKSEDYQYELNPSYEPTNRSEVVHNVIEPYAKDENTAVFSDLQKLEGVGLVVPVGEEHMYYAAMNSKACELTAVGKQYWRLVKEGRI